MSATPALFFFGAMSPYSWLAAERIESVLAQAHWRPVLLGAIFKAHDRVSWGMTDRRAEEMSECERRAAERGLGPIAWPDPWPTSDLLIARAMIHAERVGSLRPFALGAMRMAFREGADLAERGVVLEAGRRTLADPDALQAVLEDASLKESLRACTQEALDRGVFGVPTVAVGDELFWGDDRLEEAAVAYNARRTP